MNKFTESELKIMDKLEDAENEIVRMTREIEMKDARICELTEMFAQGFDADGDYGEWRECAMKSIEGGLSSSEAFIKRKQGDAIQEWLHSEDENCMGDLCEYAKSLYRRANELDGEL